jgi:hypothetical protein
MTMAHVCHAMGCGVAVPPRMLMCRRHWFMVPKNLRDDVWDAYESGQEQSKNPSGVYVVAARRAVYAVAVQEGSMTAANAADKIERLKRFLDLSPAEAQAEES